MKFLVLFAVLCVSALAAPPKVDSSDITVLSRTFSNDGNAYKFGFEQSDGQKRDETGEIKLIEKESGIVMRGSYSFVADDGITYTVNYVADENGFQPVGAHIPVAPVPFKAHWSRIRTKTNKDSEWLYPIEIFEIKVMTSFELELNRVFVEFVTGSQPMKFNTTGFS